MIRNFVKVLLIKSTVKLADKLLLLKVYSQTLTFIEEIQAGD